MFVYFRNDLTSSRQRYAAQILFFEMIKIWIFYYAAIKILNFYYFSFFTKITFLVHWIISSHFSCKIKKKFSNLFELNNYNRLPKMFGTSKRYEGKLVLF